ncbi:MAG: hypothetical protein JNK49_07580 [Planctomycetes bacterium]|nr:hypothetical protein [Planctomycetota bacterium]
MPLATDVQLASDQAVSWPPCCVACLTGEPGLRLRVARHRSTLLSFLWPLLYLVKRPTAHEVPICGNVDITVGKERVTFEFRNREYALLFLASNGGRLG